SALSPYLDKSHRLHNKTEGQSQKLQWRELRGLKGFKLHPEFARFLLDRYVNSISFKKCILCDAQSVVWHCFELNANTIMPTCSK
uniref:Uncharacterized protein n=1 Tax=Sparus aurata TaxID=8175 RepID=A0A671Z1T5_SPAAU